VGDKPGNADLGDSGKVQSDSPKQIVLLGNLNGHLSLKSSIHSVNFGQLSYRVGLPYCGYFGNFATVRNGEFRNNEASFEVSKVMYGDLTDEGVQQAVVVAACSPNNAANPGAAVSFAYVYDLRNDRPVLLGTFANGWPWGYQGWTREPERADGMILWDITDTQVEAGMLSFERFVDMRGVVLKST